MTVIDQATEQPVWTALDAGVRPIAFEANADGSTKRVFAQLSDFHGFAIVDFAQKKEVGRVELPNDVPADKIDKGPFAGAPYQPSFCRRALRRAQRPGGGFPAVRADTPSAGCMRTTRCRRS